MLLTVAINQQVSYVLPLTANCGQISSCRLYACTDNGSTHWAAQSCIAQSLGLMPSPFFWHVSSAASYHVRLVVLLRAGQKGPQAAKQQRRNEAKEKRRLQAAGKGDGPQKHQNKFMEVRLGWS